MKTVFKYPLLTTDLQEIRVPEISELLYVGLQGETLCLWALVDTDSKPTIRKIRIAGTGHPLSAETHEHLGTFMFSGGALVFHVFEVIDI